MSALDKAVQQRDRLGQVLEACRVELLRLRGDGEITTAEESATVTLIGTAMEVTGTLPKSPVTEDCRMEWRDQSGELVFKTLMVPPSVLDYGV